LRKGNPHSISLFNAIVKGKQHGASIAGVVRDASVETYTDENGEEKSGTVFEDIELVEISHTTCPSWRPSFTTLLRHHLQEADPDVVQAYLQKRQRFISCSVQTEEDTEMDKETVVEPVQEKSVEEEPTIQRALTSHGWSTKFKLTDTPWSEVTDRSERCQFAIVKLNKDGSFSKSKSVFPHHEPNCTNVPRGGLAAATTRLVQALKSHPVDTDVTLVDVDDVSCWTLDGMWYYVYKGSRFSKAELKTAARHILRHYREFDLEQPENLKKLVKSTKENAQDTEEIMTDKNPMPEVADTASEPVVEEVLDAELQTEEIET